MVQHGCHTMKDGQRRRVTLTARSVPTLPAGDGGSLCVWWDRAVPGFYLAVYGPSARHADGVRSFGVWYRVRGRPRQKRLGRFPVVGLAEARERAREIIAAARLHGADLWAAPRARSLAGLVETFLEASRRQRPRVRSDRTLDGYAELLARYVEPAAAGRAPLEELHRRDLGAMLRTIGARTPVTAARVYQLVRVACRWALREEIIDRDPSAFVDRPTGDDSRDRALRDAELAILWRAAGEDAAAECTTPAPGHAARRRTAEERAAGAQRAALARLILLTGARPGEALLLEWPELELGARLWHVPAEHRKGQRARKRPHVFPISAPAAQVLEELRAVTGGGLRAFPWMAAGHYEPHWIDPLRRRARRLGLVDPWTPHDLRRTAATGLSRLGVSRSTIAIVLGHTLQEGGAVTGVYDRFDRMPERAAALEAWGVHVAALTR